MSSKHIDLGSNPNNETIRKSHSGKYKSVATSFVTCTNGEGIIATSSLILITERLIHEQ